MKKVNIQQEFKNYKDLCNYLDEPIKGGKSKQLQLADWERYFTFEKQGNKFIITNVYDEPLEKVRKKCEDTSNYGSNNKKNIQPMMDYLLMKNGLADEEYHSWTDWWCNMLELFYRDACSIVYQDKKEIEEWCNDKSIDNATVLCEYVSAAKRVLKNLFTTALRNLEKKEYAEYYRAYHFIYELGERSKGHIYSCELADKILELEKQVCDDMNEEHHLSDKMSGRQLLMIIYGKKELTDEFNEFKLLALMDDEKALETLNDGIREMDSIMPDSAKTYINAEHPVISYSEVVAINGIEDVYEYDQDICNSLAMQISNIIRNKVRKELLNKHWTNTYTGEIIYTFANCDKDILAVEKLLFQNFDENLVYENNSDLLQTEPELDELFSNYTIDEVDEEILNKVFGVA